MATQRLGGGWRWKPGLRLTFAIFQAASFLVSRFLTDAVPKPVKRLLWGRTWGTLTSYPLTLGRISQEA